MCTCGRVRNIERSWGQPLAQADEIPGPALVHLPAMSLPGSTMSLQAGGWVMFCLSCRVFFCDSAATPADSLRTSYLRSTSLRMGENADAFEPAHRGDADVLSPRTSAPEPEASFTADIFSRQCDPNGKKICKSA